MENTLKILESVNQFYSQSFNQLVVITVALLAFAGVIMPILVSAYQKRIFKLEHNEIKESLRRELDLELDVQISKIKREYEVKEGEYERKFEELEGKLEKEVAVAVGGNFHIQGNMNLESGSYYAAFFSFTRASVEHIKAGREGNLRRALRRINEKCLPKLNKQLLEADESVTDSFSELVSMLEEFNVNGRYADDLKLLKYRYKQAQERSAKETA
ncbi:hypothetical protein [Microbulbifer elongatus]|uniref:hypothetical protein n=1 Tax=Microbulbifer elongatus TaxID=86173 RepID=UPI001CFF35EC|nr:hypothetical protein [Microbulbifer elongatus]